METLEEEVQNRLFPLLESAAATDAVLDFQDILRRFAFDTICKVTLGTDPHCLDLSRPPPPLMAGFDAAAEISARRATAAVPSSWKIKRALNIGSEAKLRVSVDLVHASLDAIIGERREKIDKCGDGKCDGGDLLSRLLAAGHAEEVVRDMVISFLMAGRDTSSAAMTWLFWLLSRHRGVEKEIIEEATSFYKDGKKVLMSLCLEFFIFKKKGGRKKSKGFHYFHIFCSNFKRKINEKSMEIKKDRYIMSDNLCALLSYILDVVL